MALCYLSPKVYQKPKSFFQITKTVYNCKFLAKDPFIVVKAFFSILYVNTFTANYIYIRHIVPMKSRITLLCSVIRLFIGTIWYNRHRKNGTPQNVDVKNQLYFVNVFRWYLLQWNAIFKNCFSLISPNFAIWRR